jgi:hypothetical protein
VLATLVDLRPKRVPLLEDFAQESLTVYIVHVCLVYGSPWNRGLRQVFGPALEPATVALFVLTLWSAMALLGISWSRFKRISPTWSGRFRFAVLGVLFVLLFV